MNSPRPVTPEDMDREQFEDGLRMTPDERVRVALDLYDLCRTACLAGIRMQHPDADDAEVERLYERRLALGRQPDRPCAACP